MALLTKEQFKKRKSVGEVKAHQWYGTAFIKKDLSKHYDVYVNDDGTMFYIYKKRK